jgi:dTDP-6-deoxy-L-talose 4-dehydrogenase [NAD(P)+]
VVNIGGGSAIAVREAVDLMIRLSGIPVRVRTTGETGGSVRSDVAWLRLDIGKADRLLGWRPQLSFEDSVRDLLSGVRTGVSHGTAPVFGLEVNSG